MKHIALACRWPLGVFPVHNRYLSSIGLHTYLDDLRSLSQKSVANLELIKIQIALTVLSSISELGCLTALERPSRCEVRSRFEGFIYCFAVMACMMTGRLPS